MRSWGSLGSFFRRQKRTKGIGNMVYLANFHLCESEALSHKKGNVSTAANMQKRALNISCQRDYLPR